MYAQIVHGLSGAGEDCELDRFIASELIPALAAETGFRGAFGLADRRSGERTLVVLWATLEQARRPRGRRSSVWHVEARV